MSGIGKLGIWALMNELNASESVELTQRIEKWGYSALWIPESFGRDPIVASSWLLAHTRTLQIATGIANIYARDSMAAVNAQYGLAELSGGRFLLGLGVSHQTLVEGVRGHKYERPISAMTTYLQAMAQVEYRGPLPPEKPKTIIAALGPKMLEIAAQFADGAHPYNVTPEHTARAREILGAGKLLYPEQMVLLEKDPSTARTIARRTLSGALSLPNYRNSLLRMGFSEQDIDNGGSNKLIDSLVAWGDEEAIRLRIQQHWDAGADHVCIQSLSKEGMGLKREDEKIFELLAPSMI